MDFCYTGQVSVAFIPLHLRSHQTPQSAGSGTVALKDLCMKLH